MMPLMTELRLSVSEAVKSGLESVSAYRIIPVVYLNV
jgi:hypothetical protein